MRHFEVTLDRARSALTGVADTSGFSERRMLCAYAAGLWSCLVEPGDGVAGRLIAASDPVDALAWVSVGRPDDAVAQASGLTAKESHDALNRWRPRLVPHAVDAAFASAARAGAVLLTPDDDAWPVGLRDLGEHAPLCLWVRGDLGALQPLHRSLAIVGARAATGYGEDMAMELAAELSGRGVTIVSGAAYGIDGAAHRGALSAGGTTVALLAGGVDRPYPVGHSQLIDSILGSGVVASEVACGTAPTKWRFLQRNRLIAALAGAVVVVEAGWRSGSINTAAHASSLGRPLGAVPGPVTSAASAGCHKLLREYDAQCITGPDDAAELLGLGSHPTLFDALDEAARTDDRVRIADALSSRSWRDIDDIARRTGMSPGEVQTQLGMMQLAGDAEYDGAGWRRAAVGVAR